MGFNILKVELCFVDLCDICHLGRLFVTIFIFLCEKFKGSLILRKDFIFLMKFGSKDG